MKYISFHALLSPFLFIISCKSRLYRKKIIMTRNFLHASVAFRRFFSQKDVVYKVLEG